MTEQTNTPDETPDEPETMTLDELGEAMLEASDQWDGDEAMPHIVTEFLRFYADLDRRITDARMASADNEIVVFAWDDEAGTLARVEITDEAISDERERQYALGYDTAHDQAHGLIHVLSYALDYAKRGEHVKGWAMVQAALDAMPTSKRVDEWPISVFIGVEQAQQNREHRARLASLAPGAIVIEAGDEPPTDLAERIIEQIHAGEITADYARESAGYPAKAASAHTGLADASTIAERHAAEQARKAE